MKLNNKEFERVFKILGEGKILLLSPRKIKTDEDIYFATRVWLGVSYGVRYLFWHGAGSSAQSYTKRDLYFITEDLFPECIHYKTLTRKQFDKALDRYFEAEFNKRQKELE